MYDLQYITALSKPNFHKTHNAQQNYVEILYKVCHQDRLGDMEGTGTN
jgi:hypothetical protein